MGLKYHVEMMNGDVWETEFQDAGDIPAIGQLYFARIVVDDGTAVDGAMMAVGFMAPNINVIYEVNPREPTNAP